MTTLELLLCFIGIHRWAQTRPFDGTEGFPSPWDAGAMPMRVCERCAKVQRWLPGYGGSEWGCWLTVRRPAEEP